MAGSFLGFDLSREDQQLLEEDARRNGRKSKTPVEHSDIPGVPIRAAPNVPLIRRFGRRMRTMGAAEEPIGVALPSTLVSIIDHDSRT